MKNNTVNVYKVIRPFGEAKINDLFLYDEEQDQYTMESEDIKPEYSVRRTMRLVPEIAELLCKEEYLIEIDAVEETGCNKCEKIEKIKDFVYKQIETYKKENTTIARDYEAGKIQPCVKVESDTVHYNLLKVLNALKDLINE